MTTFTLTGASRSLMAALAVLAATQAAEARTVEEAKAEGTIRIGIQGDNPPWGFLDSSGVQSGLDAAMGQAFAAYLGVEAEFVPLAVANRIPALETDQVDVLFATMAMTAERAQAMQYSVPYAANQLSVVAPIATTITSPEELSGLRIGVPNSSQQDKALTGMAPADAEILRFDDDAATIQALLSGQVDAVGGNQFYVQRLEPQAPGTYENKIPLTALYNGAGSRLGEADWNTELNAFLAEFITTPEYAAIYQEWLGLTPPEFPTEVEGVPFTVAQ
ncbi:transporter substrate-binding domain-containing protein [Rubellimicrobium aerolatum]|uniref:Transporter substrate-binding domain-containing protein n=1 Tax=Rubellimicrobium aerolatum TaxID=490979 RepID=A0ABW0S8J6_9RHOB|nr:transporter substrate-binding domain-containing protein [Rubellimicrobium aerolatum]MBP1804204.1 polar amino acid transport system substrate-binding protein [Rubellimicrobium aerolatum]